MPERGGRQRGRPLSQAAAWGLRIGLFVFCAFPLYWMLISSLKASHELLASPPTLLPREWELRAYRKLFYDTNFWTYFQNTIIVSALTTVIVIVARYKDSLRREVGTWKIVDKYMEIGWLEERHYSQAGRP